MDIYRDLDPHEIRDLYGRDWCTPGVNAESIV